MEGIDQRKNWLEFPFVREFCEDLCPESRGNGGGGGGALIHVEHTRVCLQAGGGSYTFYRHLGLQNFLQNDKISELD